MTLEILGVKQFEKGATNLWSKRSFKVFQKENKHVISRSDIVKENTKNSDYKPTIPHYKWAES
jgi:hypothetical protein